MYRYYGGMSVKRLPRGTRVRPVRVSWLLAEARKKRFEQIAQRAGVSTSVFLERVIDHLETELTDQGLPDWWPASDPNDGELPIETA